MISWLLEGLHAGVVSFREAADHLYRKPQTDKYINTNRTQIDINLVYLNKICVVWYHSHGCWRGCMVSQSWLLDGVAWYHSHGCWRGCMVS